MLESVSYGAMENPTHRKRGKRQDSDLLMPLPSMITTRKPCFRRWQRATIIAAAIVVAAITVIVAHASSSSSSLRLSELAQKKINSVTSPCASKQFNKNTLKTVHEASIMGMLADNKNQHIFESSSIIQVGGGGTRDQLT